MMSGNDSDMCDSCMRISSNCFGMFVCLFDCLGNEQSRLYLMQSVCRVIKSNEAVIIKRLEFS